MESCLLVGEEGRSASRRRRRDAAVARSAPTWFEGLRPVMRRRRPKGMDARIARQRALEETTQQVGRREEAKPKQGSRCEAWWFPNGDGPVSSAEVVS